MIFKLPDLGEGLPDSEIVEWHVAVGDVVKLDQLLVSMETAKAVVEVPSPVAGKVIKLYGNPGDIIKTGAPLVEFESTENKKTSEDAGTVVGKLEVGETILQEETIKSSKPLQGIKATPAVRALADRLKVDLSMIAPTGPQGAVTLQDVQQAARHITDHTHQIGDIEPLKGVRRAMAQVMSQAHAEVVPVTVMDDAKLWGWSTTEDITVRIIQAIIKACEKEPSLNAWFDARRMGRRLFSEVHLGIAMDTEEGLFVPAIRDAQNLTKEVLRQRIETLKKQVSERSIPAEELRGATITLSNFGKFAGRYANPIIVPPMVAIIGVGKVREEVVAVKGRPEVSKVLPLALTFDHRAVTGGEATRFLGEVIRALET